MSELRLLRDPPQAGGWNMAVDEALLESAARGIATLRFYRWDQATVSLGYFQSLAERESHLGSRTCPIVRRSSGGGAIIHDRELTYSVALPLSHAHWESFVRTPLGLYQAFHETLVETLAGFGITANRHVSDTKTARDPEPFLCFQRHCDGDVLMGDHKIGGSAQRRLARAVLQHGSVLLARSPVAAELPGIDELAPKSWNSTHLEEAWLNRLSGRLMTTLVPQVLAKTEVDRAKYWLANRYGNLEWLSRR